MRDEVTIRLACLMPERLLQRAGALGAKFDSVRRADDRTLVVTCDAASARVLLKLCERFSIPSSVVRLRGMSALKRFARARSTLPLGIAVAFALCALFLSHIWRVDIEFSGEAARMGDRTALEQTLSRFGIRPGMSRNVDTRTLSQAIQADMGSYSYAGARLQGVRLLVQAVPEVPAPRLYDVEIARDLVADRDGIVVRAVARSGELCVAPGDVVRRGQTLIRGEEKASTEQNRPIAALGEVIVKAWYAGEARLPKQETRIQETGNRSTSSSLSVLRWGWDITQGRDFVDQRVEEQYLPVGGLFLPVEILRRTCREIVQTRVDADDEALRARLSALAFADAASHLPAKEAEAVAITDHWTDYTPSGGELIAKAVYEIQANAAVTLESLYSG